MARVAITAAAGRMGRMIVGELSAAEGLSLCGAAEAPGRAELGTDAGLLAGVGELGVPLVDQLDALVQADAVIDFSAPEVTTQLAPLCAEHKVALVSGTTALGERELAALQAAAEAIPVVWAPNMSVGINVLLRLVDQTARLLGPAFDIEIVETHHRHKKDAPSGTAAKLAQVAAAATGGDLDGRARYGRQGLTPRGEREIGIHALRGGDVAGEHTVHFCADGERVALNHRASSRQTFAKGALRAVRWVLEQPAGLYDMGDVLGLK